MVRTHSTASLTAKWDAVERVLTNVETRFTFSHARGRFHVMTAGYGAHPGVGRKTPAAGAHVFIGHTNIFFVTVNARDRVPWMNQPAVQSSLVDIWRDQAAAWRAGYYLLARPPAFLLRAV